MNKKYSIDEYTDIINNALAQLLPVCTYAESIVCDAMKYSIKNGGKRIRPILVLEFCRLCGGNIEDAIPLACAIECIHTYSLIHDDLPCMDNDDVRRGKPSCHVKYGESYALLAGDGLLTEAFNIICNSSFADKYPQRAVKAVLILSKLSGCNGMIGGQTIDLMSEGKSITIETLRKMDELKTGALIKAACILGVIAAGGSEKEISSAADFAENLGQAFQIVDDILDVTSDEATLGKPIGSDVQSNKSTYVSLLGLEQSQKYADELTDKAIESLSVFSNDTEFLTKLAINLAHRKK